MIFQVTMAFVIDSSSSMANDLGHVKKYITQLLVEQERAKADATYVVTTFADPAIGNTRVCYGNTSSLLLGNGQRSILLILSRETVNVFV